MAKWVIAETYDRWGINSFRVYDTDSKSFEDVSNSELTRSMMNGLKLGNLCLKYEDKSPWRIYTDYRKLGCESDLIPRLNMEGELRHNGSSVVVTSIEGEFVELVNYKGQSCRVHMLQVANNVKNGKVALVNATVLDNGWIKAGRLK